MHCCVSLLVDHRNSPPQHHHLKASPHLSGFAAQVIIGNNNQASQSTSQDAINSIVNENVAGRRLLGGKFHVQQMLFL